MFNVKTLLKLASSLSYADFLTVMDSMSKAYEDIEQIAIARNKIKFRYELNNDIITIIFTKNSFFKNSFSVVVYENSEYWWSFDEDGSPGLIYSHATESNSETNRYRQIFANSYATI
jgi:hypothetical protein